jgi:hypothetical protein
VSASRPWGPRQAPPAVKKIEEQQSDRVPATRYVEDGIRHRHGGGEGRRRSREHHHGALPEHLQQVLRVSPSIHRSWIISLYYYLIATRTATAVWYIYPVVARSLFLYSSKNNRSIDQIAFDCVGRVDDEQGRVRAVGRHLLPPERVRREPGPAVQVVLPRHHQ